MPRLERSPVQQVTWCWFRECVVTGAWGKGPAGNKAVLCAPATHWAMTQMWEEENSKKLQSYNAKAGVQLDGTMVVFADSVGRRCPCPLTWDQFRVVLMIRLVFWSKRKVVAEHGWTCFARGPTELWSTDLYTCNAAVDISAQCQSMVYEHLDGNGSYMQEIIYRVLNTNCCKIRLTDWSKP